MLCLGGPCGIVFYEWFCIETCFLINFELIRKYLNLNKKLEKKYYFQFESTIIWEEVWPTFIHHSMAWQQQQPLLFIKLHLVISRKCSYFFILQETYKVQANYIWLYLASAIHRYFSHCKKILANSNFFFILQETYTYTTQLLLHISRHFSIRTDREIYKFDVISIHLPDVGAKPCL